MNTIVNRKIVVSSKLLSSKVLSLLFAIAVVLHVIAQAISREHPILAMLLAMLEALSWISILMMGVTWLIKAIGRGFPLVWHTLWTFVRTHIRFKKAQKKEVFASLEQLKQLRNNIQRLGLALYGTTPEMEMSRRTHFEMLGEAVPALPLPPRHEVLEAEFNCLVNLLNHFGFPFLESVRLQQNTLAFIQKWGSDLETRLRKLQKQVHDEKQAVQSALSMAIMVHQHIGKTYPAAQSHAGYQQIHGALQVLEKLTQDKHCPWEMIGERIPALNRGMNVVLKDLK
jgi:hypothetical protein